MNNTEIRETIIVPVKGESYTDSAELMRECKLDIKVNGIPWKTMICTSTMLRELAAGHLLAEGRIHSKKDILSQKIDESNAEACIQIVPEDLQHPQTGEETSERMMVASGKVSKLPKPERVFSLIERFLSADTMHRRTSGTHSVLLECGGHTVCIAEDINRHNALDKAVGTMLLQGLVPADCIYFTSGRVAMETVRKIMNVQAPVLISKGVPTAQAVRLAQENGIVLIGRAWPDSYEIYSGGEETDYCDKV